MKSLWSEMLEPTMFEPPEIRMGDFDIAWRWLMAQPVIALTIVRNHSIRLHRLGHNPSSEVALVGVWKLFVPRSLPPKTKPRISSPPKRKKV